ncbi:hypothetical protein BGX27_001357 [Mortierella sp. AM989]|nr:hypothetical protein BGX27_001357 [Mortierella sp. AM989]
MATLTNANATSSTTIADAPPELEVALTSTEPKGQQATLQEIHQDGFQGSSVETPDSSQGDSNQRLDIRRSDVYVPVKQLSESEALQEEERASEKIRQKLRHISKLNTARRNIVQTFSHEDSFEEASGPITDHAQRDSISSVGVGSIGSAIGSSIRAHSKVKLEAKPHQKHIPLIEVEPARLVDAQTASGDHRYFQSPGDSKMEGDFVYEFLYQHQRGAFFFGTPQFSSKSLLPVDPDEWTDDKFERSPMDITAFVVPDPSWEWVHKSWLVDMTGDVDEDGWEYAMTFHGSPWHGSYEPFQSFARRRRWIRLRKRKGKTLGKPSPLPERNYPASINSATWTKLDVSEHLCDPSPFPPEEPDTDGPSCESGQPDRLRPPKNTDPIDLYKVLKKARSDREKLAYTAQYVVRYPGHLDDLVKRLDLYLNLLDYETSRREFLSLLAAYSGEKTKIIQESVSHLEFFSDRKKLDSLSEK